MTYLSHAEASELLDLTFNTSGEDVAGGIEATLIDMGVSQALADVESYLALFDRWIDPDSIRIAPDRVEHCDLPCVAITIKVAE